MRIFASLRSAVSALFHRSLVENEVEEELRAHIQDRANDLERSGVPHAEAERRARLEFGGYQKYKEEIREAQGVHFLETLIQDLRFGLRMLRKSPGFTAVAVLTLALGIGANTAIFSLLDAVMLRSLPVTDPSRLVLLQWSARQAPDTDGYWSSGDCAENIGFGANPSSNPSGCVFSEPLFRRIREVSAFSGVAAFATSGQLNLTGNGPASLINGQLVSGDFFRTTGIAAAAGRLIDRSDDLTSAAPVAVLNYGYWQSAFGGSLSAIGRVIELNGVAFTIIGVAEPRFSGIAPGSDYEVWLPLSNGRLISDPRFWANRQDDASYWWLTVLGRVKPKAELAATQAEVSGIFRNEMLHGSKPLFHGEEVAGGSAPHADRPRTLADNPQITLVSAQTGLTGARPRYSDPLHVLMLTVAIILLVACANVAGLILARATVRKKEVAVRLTLGAAGTRIVRQLLTESLILSTMGGILGILLAYWGARAIVAFVSQNQPRPLGFAAGVDTSVLGFTIAISLLTGILFGIAPAFRSVRVDLIPALKEGEGTGSGSSHGKWFSLGNGLVVAQVAMAVVVLVGAGLLVRTLENLRSVDLGFDARNIVIFKLNPVLAGYKDAQIPTLYRDLQGRLADMPGVISAAYSQAPPVNIGQRAMSFHWPGTPQDQESVADYNQIGSNFFKTIGISLIYGRDFNISDFEVAAANRGDVPTTAPTPIIVNQTFVAKYAGKENPLGAQFGQTPATANGPAHPGARIIGVVRDARDRFGGNVGPIIYAPQTGGAASFELRVAGNPPSFFPDIRHVVARVNSDLPVSDLNTEVQQLDRFLYQQRLIADLSGFFGVLALVLASVGLYGLLSYEVTRRTREIGIRIAFGARPGNVLKEVLGQGFTLTVIGAAIGVGVALGLTRYLTSMLYGVHANDPSTMTAVAVLLALVSLVACYIPARRAMRVDPMVALRHE